MSKLRLTFACGGYDRMQPLQWGAVQPEGIDLNFLEINAPREIFDRMSGRREFEVSEMSASEFICQTGRGQKHFVALPVFPSKVFRHGFMFVNRRAGIGSPKDLEGKRVGMPLYTQTAMIWVRGHLQHDYDVDLSKIHWVQGAVEKAGSHGNPHALPLLKPVPIEVNHTDKSLGQLLAEGAIDAVVGSRAPEVRHPDIVRLFPDYRAVEREYYKRTKIHPIMHLVVIRREVYEANPWIGSSLYKAFEESKRRAIEAMRFSGAQRLMLPWLYADIDEYEAVFGDDPWPYGVEANRPTLEAMVAYMVEQDFIAKPIPVDDLFIPVYGH